MRVKGAKRRVNAMESQPGSSSYTRYYPGDNRAFAVQSNNSPSGRYRTQSWHGSSANGSGAPRRRRHKCSQAAAAAAPGSQPRPLTMSDLPGFTWDPVRRRYFRVLPDQRAVGASGNYTYTALHLRKREQQRLRLVQGIESMDQSPKSNRKQTKRSVTHSLLNRDKGMCSNESLRRLRTEECVRHMAPRATLVTDVLSEHPDHALSHCQFMEGSSDGRTIVGAWRLKQPYAGAFCTRIMCLEVNGGHRHTEGDFGLRIAPSDDFTYASDPCVTDFCKAPVDRGVTCVLYVTMASLPALGSGVFLQPVPQLSSEDDEDIMGSPIYNIDWTMEQGISACAWNSNKMRVGLGMEKYSLVVDVVAETDFRLSSRHRNVIAQRFTKDGNLMYMGLRSSEIICSDLRLPSHHIVSSLPQMSTCWLQLLTDSNFLIAANFHGELKLWDVRNKKTLHEFLGHNNTHSKLPFTLDDTENLLFAAGEDGVTRGWSVRSGTALCAVPSPHPVSSSNDVPRISYSNRWAGIEGNAALLLAVRDQLHVYEMRL